MMCGITIKRKHVHPEGKEGQNCNENFEIMKMSESDEGVKWNSNDAHSVHAGLYNRWIDWKRVRNKRTTTRTSMSLRPLTVPHLCRAPSRSHHGHPHNPSRLLFERCFVSCGDFLPIQHGPDILHEIGAHVLVLQVVRVLPPTRAVTRHSIRPFNEWPLARENCFIMMHNKAKSFYGKGEVDR